MTLLLVLAQRVDAENSVIPNVVRSLIPAAIGALVDRRSAALPSRRAPNAGAWLSRGAFVKRRFEILFPVAADPLPRIHLRPRVSANGRHRSRRSGAPFPVTRRVRTAEVKIERQPSLPPPAARRDSSRAQVCSALIVVADQARVLERGAAFRSRNNWVQSSDASPRNGASACSSGFLSGQKQFNCRAARADFFRK